MITAHHCWRRHSQLSLGTISWRRAYTCSLNLEVAILRYSKGLKIWLHHCMCVAWIFNRLRNVPQIFQSSFYCFLLIIIICYNALCPAKEMYIKCVREALKMQKERRKDSINNFKNCTRKEISARENMVSGGTVNLWHSYKTLCNSSSSPGAISVCTVLFPQGLHG